jgi:hypothetical protein
MTTILFSRCSGDSGHLFTCWQGEIRVFLNAEAAASFAKRQGLIAIFEPVDDWHDGSLAE